VFGADINRKRNPKAVVVSHYRGVKAKSSTGAPYAYSDVHRLGIIQTLQGDIEIVLAGSMERRRFNHDPTAWMPHINLSGVFAEMLPIPEFTIQVYGNDPIVIPCDYVVFDEAFDGLASLPEAKEQVEEVIQQILEAKGKVYVTTDVEGFGRREQSIDPDGGIFNFTERESPMGIFTLTKSDKAIRKALGRKR